MVNESKEEIKISWDLNSSKVSYMNEKLGREVAEIAFSSSLVMMTNRGLWTRLPQNMANSK